jgi:hypothetical protein
MASTLLSAARKVGAAPGAATPSDTNALTNPGAFAASARVRLLKTIHHHKWPTIAPLTLCATAADPPIITSMATRA